MVLIGVLRLASILVVGVLVGFWIAYARRRAYGSTILPRTVVTVLVIVVANVDQEVAYRYYYYLPWRGLGLGTGESAVALCVGLVVHLANSVLVEIVRGRTRPLEPSCPRCG